MKETVFIYYKTKISLMDLNTLVGEAVASFTIWDEPKKIHL